MNKFSALALLIVSPVALLGHTAIASTAAVERSSIRVRYDDLDLSDMAGATVLHRRILQAADRVCGGYERRDLRREMQHQRCVHDAARRALAEVNWPKPQS